MMVKAEMTKLLAKTGSTLVIVADTTMVTIGSQARGLTGIMIWMIGLKDALTAFASPHIRPSGPAPSVASTTHTPPLLQQVHISSWQLAAPPYAQSLTVCLHRT